MNVRIKRKLKELRKYWYKTCIVEANAAQILFYVYYIGSIACPVLIETDGGRYGGIYGCNTFLINRRRAIHQTPTMIHYGYTIGSLMHPFPLCTTPDSPQITTLDTSVYQHLIFLGFSAAQFNLVIYFVYLYQYVHTYIHTVFQRSFLYTGGWLLL